MCLKKLFHKQKQEGQDIKVFVLLAELSFRTVAQVSYIDELGHVKIVRFFSDSWSREVLSLSGDVSDLDFKIFVHSPNLSQPESVRLSVVLKDEIIRTKDFTVSKDNDFAGWFELG